jgi:hypothetical protein
MSDIVMHLRVLSADLRLTKAPENVTEPIQEGHA